VIENAAPPCDLQIVIPCKPTFTNSRRKSSNRTNPVTSTPDTLRLSRHPQLTASRGRFARPSTWLVADNSACDPDQGPGARLITQSIRLRTNSDRKADYSPMVPTVGALHLQELACHNFKRFRCNPM